MRDAIRKTVRNIPIWKNGSDDPAAVEMRLKVTMAHDRIYVTGLHEETGTQENESREPFEDRSILVASYMCEAVERLVRTYEARKKVKA